MADSKNQLQGIKTVVPGILDNEIVKSWNEVVDLLDRVQKLWPKHVDIYRAKAHTIQSLPIEAQKVLLPAFHKMQFQHFLDFINRYSRGDISVALKIKEGGA